MQFSVDLISLLQRCEIQMQCCGCLYYYYDSSDNVLYNRLWTNYCSSRYYADSLLVCWTYVVHIY